MIFWILLFFLFGILIFSLTVGFIFFNQMFLRPKNDSSLNKQTIATALAGLQQSVPAEELDGVKMQGSGNLASHLNDKKIMIPLLQAKLEWISQYEEGSLEQIKIKPSKNTTLSGFLVLPKTYPKYIAILLHGYTDSSLGMAYLAKEYLKNNFGVLAIDARSHGFSSGKHITMGYKEAKDFSLWIQELNNIIEKLQQENKFESINSYEQKPKIILHGVSMGAAAVMESLSNKKISSQSNLIALAVADCGFASFNEQLSTQINCFLGKNPFQKGLAYLIIFGMSIINFCVNGFFFFQNSPKKALVKRRKMSSRNIPLVIFHGTEDTFVNFKVIETIEKAAKGNIKINLIKDAPHIGSYFYAPEKYMQTIFQSLKD